MKDTFIIRDAKVRARVIGRLFEMDLEKPWRVTIEPYRKRRSLSQNAYLHLILNVIADETGNSIDDVKDAYREMFLGRVPITLGEEERMVGRSTTTLDTAEINAFIEKIRAHAATELGINTPVPEEAHLRAA